MRAMGSGVAIQSSTKWTVLLQRNKRYHATHINRGTVFSVGSAPRLITQPTELVSSEINDLQRGREAVNMEVEGSTALEDITRQMVKTKQTEKT
jgi:hypothetical protein